VFENRVLRNIVGPEGEEVAEDWRKLHEERHELYFTPGAIRSVKSRMRDRPGM
jgi:hypothetical protein